MGAQWVSSLFTSECVGTQLCVRENWARDSLTGLNSVVKLLFLEASQ